MARTITPRSKIDARLEHVLDDADDADVPLVREAIETPDDRWYGQLVVSAYASLADTRDPDAVFPAATAIELLRGYAHLRSRLLVQLAGERARSPTLDPSSALLAGDYLYTSAYSSLSASPRATRECFEVLTTVLETIAETFASTYAPSAPSKPSQTAFFDETAGAIGEGAAVLGAILAGVGGVRRDCVASVGRGFSTARAVHRVLDSECETAAVAPLALDESRLRAYANRRRDEADRTLEDLSTTADVSDLRTLASKIDSTTDRS